MKLIKQTCYKGTNIILGNEKRDLINKMIDILRENQFIEIQIPIIQFQETFEGKVGEENNNMMYCFSDRKDRQLCLAPEYTAVIQKLSQEYFKYNKDVKLFYVAECFRGERPQAGRYRQFTQLGVEIINPSQPYDLWKLAISLCMQSGLTFDELTVTLDTQRGLDYYKEGKGFEISCDKLGSSKQLCGGGEYEGGVGFAIGIDRLLNFTECRDTH